MGKLIKELIQVVATSQVITLLKWRTGKAGGEVLEEDV
jgi:hypothetical protein